LEVELRNRDVLRPYRFWRRVCFLGLLLGVGLGTALSGALWKPRRPGVHWKPPRKPGAHWKLPYVLGCRPAAAQQGLSACKPLRRWRSVPSLVLAPRASGRSLVRLKAVAAFLLADVTARAG